VKTKLTALVAFALALSACSTATTVASNPQALTRGVAVKTLDAGKLDSLPTGPVYIRMIRFAQPVGYVINSKQHVASVVYVETGVHRLILNGQPPHDLVAGQAMFHQSVMHTHLNPGPLDPSVWYSIALWPSSARSQSLVDKIAYAAFESLDFSRESLPQVAYSQVLRLVTLAKDGTSGAHQFGGLSAFYVLSGSVTIRSAHQPLATLGIGQGVAFVPDVALQETNTGAGQAVFLEFITTPVGKDFEVPLRQPPPP
jgi:quercetin dioxygenase-like cupin family protein